MLCACLGELQPRCPALTTSPGRSPELQSLSLSTRLLLQHSQLGVLLQHSLSHHPFPTWSAVPSHPSGSPSSGMGASPAHVVPSHTQVVLNTRNNNMDRCRSRSD